MTDSGTIIAQAQAAVAARRQKREQIMPLWLGTVIGAMLIFNGLPFLAPLFMKVGWESVGRIIYMVYSGLCHQMAQRSFFLFGPKSFQMYNIAELPMNLAGLSNGERFLALRRFIGNESIGWKVAWSDRMVYMYMAPLLLAIGYAILRRFKPIKPLPFWAFILLLLPMLIDGGSHWISDLAGVGQGFRYGNAWLAALTGNTLPKSFYLGDAFGSFNSWMRLISGVAFGAGIIGLAFPYVEEAAAYSLSLPEQQEPAQVELHRE